jgi:2'-5' RNA ligase
VRERLFVALWLPDAVRAELDTALAALHARYPELRWQPPVRWHITLAFLGDREPDRELRRFATIPLVTPEPLELVGSGRFGPILWVGLDLAPWLAVLADSVQHTMRCRERRFRGHVTVARSRTSPGRRQLARAATELAAFRSQPWTPQHLTLVRSTTGPKPAYEVIGRTPLANDGS